MDTTLVKAAEAALSALETPGDLTTDEFRNVIEDLDYALRPYRKE